MALIKAGELLDQEMQRLTDRLNSQSTTLGILERNVAGITEVIKNIDASMRDAKNCASEATNKAINAESSANEATHRVRAVEGVAKDLQDPAGAVNVRLAVVESYMTSLDERLRTVEVIAEKALQRETARIAGAAAGQALANLNQKSLSSYITMMADHIAGERYADAQRSGRVAMWEASYVKAQTLYDALKKAGANLP